MQVTIQILQWKSSKTNPLGGGEKGPVPTWWIASTGTTLQMKNQKHWILDYAGLSPFLKRVLTIRINFLGSGSWDSASFPPIVPSDITTQRKTNKLWR